MPAPGLAGGPPVGSGPGNGPPRGGRSPRFAGASPMPRMAESGAPGAIRRRGGRVRVRFARLRASWAARVGVVASLTGSAPPDEPGHLTRLRLPPPQCEGPRTTSGSSRGARGGGPKAASRREGPGQGGAAERAPPALDTARTWVRGLRPRAWQPRARGTEQGRWGRVRARPVPLLCGPLGAGGGGGGGGGYLRPGRIT